MLNKCRYCSCKDCSSEICELHGDHSIYSVHFDTTWKLAEVVGAMFSKNGVID